VEALQEKTLMQDSQVQEEYVKVQNQNENLKRMLQIQRAIEEFVEELKET
jgi:glutaredoxin-related protein